MLSKPVLVSCSIVLTLLGKAVLSAAFVPTPFLPPAAGVAIRSPALPRP